MSTVVLLVLVSLINASLFTPKAFRADRAVAAPESPINWFKTIVKSDFHLARWGERPREPFPEICFDNQHCSLTNLKFAFFNFQFSIFSVTNAH